MKGLKLQILGVAWMWSVLNPDLINNLSTPHFIGFMIGTWIFIIGFAKD